MTLNEYHRKPIATKSDGIALLREAPFKDVLQYIEDGPDTKVSTILAALWASRTVFTNQQIVDAATAALFPKRGYMRRTTSSSAIMLAKAVACQHELQIVIKNRWPKLTDVRQCNEFVLALSDTKDISDWIPFVRDLFVLNPIPDVRSGLLKAVHNMWRVAKSEPARRCLVDFLEQMPTSAADYSKSSFLFVSSLRDKLPMIRLQTN
jgi:hypothetical protein